MGKSKSSYKWKFKNNILAIEDLNTGETSVTNNIVNVLFEIKQKLGYKIHDSKIIYRDSEMIWDGVDAEWTIGGCSDVSFYSIGELKLTDALKKIKK